MIEISELARQLYVAILERGYTSPENTWQQYDILNELFIGDPSSYNWLKELERSGQIVRIPTTSIKTGDRFYAVPPDGYVPPTAPAAVPAKNHAELRASLIEVNHRPIRNKIDWQKWGAILAGVSIVVSILLWQFS